MHVCISEKGFCIKIAVKVEIYGRISSDWRYTLISKCVLAEFSQVIGLVTLVQEVVVILR